MMAVSISGCFVDGSVEKSKQLINILTQGRPEEITGNLIEGIPELEELGYFSITYEGNYVGYRYVQATFEEMSKGTIILANFEDEESATNNWFVNGVEYAFADCAEAGYDEACDEALKMGYDIHEFACNFNESEE